MPEEAQKKINEISDAVQIAEELSKSIHRINELFAFKKKVNFIIRVLFVAVFIDVAITITFVLFFNALHHAQAQACANTNDARHAQVILWQDIIRQFGPKNPTPDQVSRQKIFLSFVSKKLAPIDCSRL